MTVSRRQFLVAGQTLFAAALPVEFLGAASVFGGSKNVNLASLTKANFEPLVNSSFAVSSAGVRTVWFTLLSVEDLNDKTAPAKPQGTTPKHPKTLTPKMDTFALHFRGTGEALEQGTYELEHGSLGKFSLFVVPSGASTYAAVVSHIVSGSVPPPPQRIKTIKSASTASAAARPEIL
jgi:hypothetical protein